MQELFGDFDSNLRLLKERYSVKVYAKGLDVFVAGENQDVTAARGVLSNMLREKFHITHTTLQLEPTAYEKDARTI